LCVGRGRERHGNVGIRNASSVSTLRKTRFRAFNLIDRLNCGIVFT